MNASLRRSKLDGARIVLAAVAAAVLLAAAQGAHAAGSGPTTVLAGAAVKNLASATLTGTVPAARQITVGLFLTNPNQAAEDAYVKQLYTSGSSTYLNFLDPDSFQQQFGIAAATFQAAQAWLAGGGLSVTAVDGTTNYVLATGTAAQVSALFATPLNTYSGNGKTFYANAVAPKVPTSLGIGAVLGLNDINRFSIPRVAAPVATKTTTGTIPPSGSVPDTGILSPRALWSIYDQPDTNLANGQTMAIFGWGVTDPVIPDLRSFESEWRLPQVPVTVKHFGASDTPDTSGDGATVEWELDTQASTGMAPNVSSETLYFGHHNTDADVLAAIAAWVNDRHGPLQGSASFGECENIPAAEGAIGTDQMEAAGDKVLEQAAAEGRTLFASTGDTGSSCPVVPVSTNGVATQVYPGLEWPSVSPWAVAVGGTDLTGDGATPEKRLAETAWEFTGGGNSTTEPAGSYQAGVASTNCLFDQNGNPYVPGVTAAGPVCRSTPDVAAISGDVATGNGMSITDDNGADQQGAGTSLSSPLWLGMWTRVQAAASGKGLGFANYALYRVGKSSGGRDFYDVTIGDNQPYPAKPGYDNTTGWGTPELSQLMLDLTGRLTPVRNAPAGPVTQTTSTTCSTLFTDPSGDDSYAVEGQVLGAQGAQPQLDILSAKLLLSADHQTLRSIITVRNLSATVPTGGVENDYNIVWTFGGTTYFTQLAVEPNGSVQAYDGELLHVALENRYQQLHVDTGVVALGANGTVEVDVPLANIGAPALGATLQQPSAASYVREGAVAGPLEPIDSGGPGNDYILGGC